MPDAPAPRKSNRFWLFAPFIAVAIAFAAWSGWWFYSKDKVLTEFDRLAQGGRGYQLAYKSRAMGGYPFRYEIALDEPVLTETSGWGLAAPRLEVVASAFDPSHAVIVAPRGVILNRPNKGAVAIEGEVLRASFGGWPKRVRFSVEGRNLVITPKPGATPMPFSAADGFQLHLRPEGGDVDRLYLGLNGATPTAGTMMARVTDAKASLQLESTLSQAHALTGRDWPSLLRNWSAAGGQMKVVKSAAQVGQAQISADDSQLTVTSDGYLQGKLDLRLQQTPQALGALGAVGVLPPATAEAAQGVAPDKAHVAFKFRDGTANIGSFPIGKAPRLY